jgi:ATP/maltotriose-dependent transcriptional regulator MalT
MDTKTGKARLLEVVELLRRGAWQDAHAIVQRDKSAEAAWLHGIVHTLEGDIENAEHWYRKAKRPFPGADAVQREIAAARDLLLPDHPHQPN